MFCGFLLRMLKEGQRADRRAAHRQGKNEAPHMQVDAVL